MSFQDKFQAHVSNLDKELSKFPQLQRLEQRSGVPKVYAILGVGLLYIFFIFMNWGGQLLSNLAGVALPTYYSLRAIETAGGADDTKMLTYWVVYGLLTIVEYWSNTILYWMPFYFLIKTVFLLWLVLPQFEGAVLVYQKVIRPVTLKYTKASTPSEALKREAKSH
ncbi:ER membrane protein DP1/Yop1 [Savitreella phatthalungensis]